MKKICVFVFIFFTTSLSFFGQTYTGAIASVPGSSNGNTDAIAGCDDNCDEQALYTWFAPMNGKVCDGTQISGNYGGGSPGDHWPMQISVYVPSGCTVTVKAEYGGPNNLDANCGDSRMDQGGPDVFGINAGMNSPGTTIDGDYGTNCIGTCAAGPGGMNGDVLFGGVTNIGGTVGAPGCYKTGANGNSDVICTKTGVTNSGVTIWGMSNRADEIVTYTITGTAGTCTAVGYIVLPVEIIGFGAYRIADNAISVQWSTATETNNNYFMVEYSLDGLNFIPFKEIKGAGNSTSRKDYSCIFDVAIGSATPYFRLKQVDYNGNYKYSTIAVLGTALGYLKTIKQVNVYYSITQDKLIARFHLDAPSQINIQLYNIKGEEVYKSNTSFNEGDNEILIDTDNNTAGIYFLVYQNGSLDPVHIKVMVTK
jgi:hypothetical protein